MSLIDSLQARLDDEVSAVPAFGGAILRDGEVVAGHAVDTPLPPCSTIKVAVAMAVLSVVQEGAIDLDTPVLELDSTLRFPDPAHASTITLRQLLSHTSGLGDTDRVEPDPRAVLARLEVVAGPGRAFRYSNVAFDIAQEVAADAAGTDAFGLLHNRVLAPLGMDATRQVDRAKHTDGAGLGGGGMETTATDLARLADELLGGGQVLTDQSRDEMTRIHVDTYTNAPNRYYGLGVSVEHWDGHVLYAHGGGLGRYGSAFVVDPAHGTAAAFIFDDPRGYGVSPHAYLDALAGRTSRQRPVRAATVDWRDYTGTYTNGATLLDEGDTPVLDWNGQRAALSAVDDRLFAGEGRISVGLLPGSPTMISVNNFILIGARPGIRRD